MLCAAANWDTGNIDLGKNFNVYFVSLFFLPPFPSNRQLKDQVCEKPDSSETIKPEEHSTYLENSFPSGPGFNHM